ncbi:MAG: dienelactone hydrolase family protein [Acidaminobacteraceae bacterium]
MNLFELIFLLFALIIFVIPHTRNDFMKKPVKGIACGILMLVALSWFSLRWQMAPMFILYTIYVIVFLFMTYNGNYEKFKIKGKIFRRIGVVFISVALIINILFPLNDLSKFKGKYYVGTSTINITDYNRQNKNMQMGKFRNISVRMFYPSYKSGVKKHKLIDNPTAFNETTKRNYGTLISNLFDYVNELETNSYYDVEPVEDETFPLIVINHDWMEYPEYYYDLAEKISADGYYVAVVNYTGNSPYTTLKDSNIEFGNTKLLGEGISNANYKKNVEKISSEVSDDFNQVIEGIIKLKKTSEKRFANIDLKNIGIIGTGIGARIALDSTSYLNVGAVIAYDPYVESNPSYFLKNKLEKQSLILISEEWNLSVNTRYLVQILGNGSMEDKKMYYIKNFNHKDFTLMGMLTPLYKFNSTTKASYKRSLDIRYNTTKAYFDYHLKNLNTKKYMTDLIEADKYITKIMLR